jgi:hypothetical protein
MPSVTTICLVTLSITINGFAETSMNLAERLGYPSDTRLLIVHADDAGMCHAVNAVTQSALVDGIVSSASVMVPCPWFPEMAAFCREHPDSDCGIHLTLTSEWQEYRWKPVSSPNEVPGLVDPEGFLCRETRDVATHATAQEVEKECRAQIDRALAFGMRPTHLDSHMGTMFARPDYFEIYVRLALEYRIPAMIPRPTPETIARFRNAGYPNADALIELASSGRVPTIDDLTTGVVSRDFEQRLREYHEVIRNLKPGVSQIIVHLGDDSAEIRAIMNSWLARQNDDRAFRDPATRALLKEQNVRLIGWRDIQALMSE